MPPVVKGKTVSPMPHGEKEDICLPHITGSGGLFDNRPFGPEAANPSGISRKMSPNLPQLFIFQKATRSCPIATDSGLPAAAKYDSVKIPIWESTDSTAVQRIEACMKKLSLLLACALLLTTTSLASAACSPEEAQKKANEFAAAVQKKSQADPQGYAKIMQELQPQLLKLQQEQNLENMCKFYDDALEKLK